MGWTGMAEWTGWTRLTVWTEWKDVTLHNIKTNGNTACCVTPLNQSETDPETVRANMKDNSIRNIESAIFQVTEGAIKKPAFLGKTINNMCSGVSIYWLSPKCGGNSTDLAERPGSEDDVKTRSKRSNLACVECGCYRLYSPWVRCTRRVIWGTAYYTLYYHRRPVYLFRVSYTCNSGLRTSRFGQIRQDRRGNNRSSHDRTGVETLARVTTGQAWKHSLKSATT
ncbi:hypothetical protein LSAT2_032703 [Lamellibrachia satsuma]|nr:hypothetical protein LSAT2_032703 [Lamellibrachia satsuma]